MRTATDAANTCHETRFDTREQPGQEDLKRAGRRELASLQLDGRDVGKEVDEQQNDARCVDQAARVRQQRDAQRGTAHQGHGALRRAVAHVDRCQPRRQQLLQRHAVQRLPTTMTGKQA